MSEIIVKAIQIALAARKIKPAEVIAEIEDGMRRVRMDILIVHRRMENCPLQWAKTKVQSVVGAVDSLLPADAEGASIFTQGSRAKDKFTADFVATSDGTIYDRGRIRSNLQTSAIAVGSLLLMAEAVKWEKAKKLRELSTLLHHAITMVE